MNKKIKILNIIRLSYLKFVLDKCNLQASNLTFYSIFSVVPFLAVSFGIAKGFALENYLEEQLLSNFANQEIILKHMISFAQNMLAETKGGLIIGFGLLFLFVGLIKMLNQIELSFNYIWGVKKLRPFINRVSYYICLIFLGPIIFLSTSSVNVLLINKSVFFNYYISSIFTIIILCLFFSWLYMFLPKIKIKYKTAFISASFTSLALYILQTIIIKLQIVVGSFGPIYGSFSVLPIFFMWIQFSWILILLGAELNFILHNKITEKWQLSYKDLSWYKKKKFLNNIINIILDYDSKYSNIISLKYIKEKSNLPENLLRLIVEHLVLSNIIFPLSEEYYKNISYQINKSLIYKNKFKLYAVLEKV